MFGVLVNTLAVVLGSGAGMVFRRGIPEKITKAVMAAIGLCTLYLGISGSLAGRDALVVILSLVLGTALGTALQLDDAISRLGDWAESKLKKPLQQGPSIGEGFVTASLLFCVGSMAVVGSLNAGLKADHSMLLAKSALDLVASAMLAASLGPGVLLSALSVLIFQGSIVLLAGALQPLLSDAAIAEMTCAGSLLIMGLGLNLLGVTKLKIADMMPAILMAPLLAWLAGLFA